MPEPIAKYLRLNELHLFLTYGTVLIATLAILLWLLLKRAKENAKRLLQTTAPQAKKQNRNDAWRALGIGLLILCFLVSLPSFRKGFWEGWEGVASRETPNSSLSLQVGNPNNAADAEAQWEAQFEKDFYEIYPELKPYSRVCEATASSLQATGYKSQSREAVMEAIAQAARKIVALQQAAEQGDALAQCKLGWMFHTGNGVPQNYAEAFKWYSAAAQEGDATAQNNLGVMFHNGQAVQRDDVKAYKWYCLSAAQGDTDAKNNRDTLLRSLTPQQIAEAQGEAANPGHNPQSVAAAEFERDFFEKYPDLRAHKDVLDAVAQRLEASGYKGESREAVMETFAKAAREELVRRDEADHAAEIQLLADKALRYNIDLALKGNDYGEYRMGQRCRDGEDVPKDLKKAREWFIKAAAQGNKAAIKELAHLLEDFPDLSATNNPHAEIKPMPIVTNGLILTNAVRQSSVSTNLMLQKSKVKGVKPEWHLVKTTVIAGF